MRNFYAGEGNTLGRRLIYFSTVVLPVFLTLNAIAQIAFVSSSVGRSPQGNNIVVTVNAPDSIQEGDLLIADFGVMSALSDSILPNNGWTQIRCVQDYCCITTQYFYKVALPSDVGRSFSFIASQTGYIYKIVCVISAYRGVDATDPIDVEAAFSSDTAMVTSIATPSVNTHKPNEMIVTFFGNGNHSNSAYCPIYTIPAGMTFRYTECVDTYDVGITSTDVLKPTPGPTGNLFASQNGDVVKMIAEIVALNPKITGLQETSKQNKFQFDIRLIDGNFIGVSSHGYQGTMNISIYDILGKQLISKVITGRLEENETLLNIENILPGLYIINISNRDKNWTGKFIKG